MNSKATKEILTNAVRSFAEKLFSIDTRVKSIIVGGSILRDDFVPGFSDVDVYIFISFKDVDSYFFLALRNALKFVRDKMRIELKPDIFFVEELPRLLNQSVAINDLIENRMVVYGKDIFKGLKHGDLLKVAQRILALDEMTIRRMLYLSDFNMSFLKRAIKICISVAKVCLFFKGIYLLNKRDIVRVFKQKFPEFSRHFHTLDEAYRLRMEFPSLKLSEEEIRSFIFKVYEFLKDVRFHFVDDLDGKRSS